MSLDPFRDAGPPPKEIRSESDVSSTFLPSRWELRDFLAGWLLLTVAFTLLLMGGGRSLVAELTARPDLIVTSVIVSAIAAGTGFVLHELAHKLVAVWLGHDAAFRANYGMLGLAVALALAGFIFAAPGAVYHRRDVPTRHEGLIALAGPVTNLVAGIGFLVPLVVGVFAGSGPLFSVGSAAVRTDVLLVAIGVYGVVVNFLLAGFNMLPLGPLDGATVYVWNRAVYVTVAVPCVLLGAGAYLLGF